jgi:membrane-associated phospholipid phosphatase
VKSDPYVLAAFAVGTVAMFPLDRHLASVVRDEDLVANRRLREAASVFRFFGGPGPYVIGTGLYVVGRVTKAHRVAELGLHGTEAVVVAQAVSGVLKVGLGRARPYTSADTNAHSFGFFRGLKGSDFQSFPSGHSTSAFAAAAAVQAETTAWWPSSKWILGPLLYGGASMVGLSRIYEDKHWASDVVVGAAIGTFAGLKVVRFNHTHQGNRIDRWLLGTSTRSGLRLSGDGTSFGVVGHYTW